MVTITLHCPHCQSGALGMARHLHEGGLANVDVRHFGALRGGRSDMEDLNAHGHAPCLVPLFARAERVRRPGAPGARGCSREADARGSAELGERCSVGWLVDAVCSAWLSSLVCLSWCTKRARGRRVRTEMAGKREAGEAASAEHSRLVAARGIACRRPVGRSTITWGVLRFIRTGSLGSV